MIALYIIIGLGILISVILSCFVGLDVKLSNDSLTINHKVLFVKYGYYPEKTKPYKYRKTAKKLKNKKISEIHFNADSSSNKKKKKIKIIRSGIFFEDIIKKLSEMSDDPESAYFTLNFLKELIKVFPNSLHLRIRSLKVKINSGDAAKDCVEAGALDSFMNLFIVFADKYSKMKKIKNNSVYAVPSFDNKGSECLIDFSIRFTVYKVLKASIKSLQITESTKVIHEREK